MYKKNLIFAVLMMSILVSCGTDNIDYKKLSKQCETILVDGLENVKLQESSTVFINRLSNRRFINTMQKHFYKTNTTFYERFQIYEFSSNLRQGELFLNFAYKKAKHEYLRDYAMLLLLKRKNNIVGYREVKSRMEVLVKTGAWEKYLAQGFPVYDLIRYSQNLYLTPFLKKRFLTTNDLHELTSVYETFKKHKYKGLNAIILQRLKNKKNVKFKFYLATMLNPNFGSKDDVIAYLKKQTSKGFNEKYYPTYLYRLQVFLPKENIYYKSFKQVNNPHDKVSMCNVFLTGGLVKRKDIPMYIDRMIEVGSNKKDFPYFPFTVLFKYEKKHKKITNLYRKYLKEKKASVLIDILRFRGVEKSEIKYIVHLLRKPPSYLRLVAAYRILKVLYGSKKN